MLLLSFAVVCWGLHDKLSLYAPPHADPIAKAKLLTEQERTPQANAVAPQPPAPIAPVFIVLFAALLNTLPWLLSRVLLRDSRYARPKSPPLTEALHRRPPPAKTRAPLCAVLGAAPAISPALA